MKGLGQALSTCGRKNLYVYLSGEQFLNTSTESITHAAACLYIIVLDLPKALLMACASEQCGFGRGVSEQHGDGRKGENRAASLVFTDSLYSGTIVPFSTKPISCCAIPPLSIV